MNATDSFLVPLVDGGRLSGLKGGPLGPRFRFWRDQNGKRHVFSVYAADAAPDYPDALAVVARRTPAGPIALWAGAAGEDARKAAERFLAEEIHIYVLGEDAPESLLDLRQREARRIVARGRMVEDAPPLAPPALPAPLFACLGQPRGSRRAA